jgi:hypothetical protein
MVAERGSDDKVTLYVSWNGATEVATWEVLAGPEPDQIKPIGSVPRHGFETAITVGTAERYVGVQAKDKFGSSARHLQSHRGYIRTFTASTTIGSASWGHLREPRPLFLPLFTNVLERLPGK